MPNAFDRLRRLWPRRLDSDVDRWREQWAEAVRSPADRARIRALRTALDRLSATSEDLEIEREMLEGIERLHDLASRVAQEGLPAIATGHRVVGAAVCHFSAPASMPDDASQPSGRLLLTGVRGIFVGGSRSVTLPWHAVGRALQSDRDLVIVRADGSAVHRFRFNSFEDALTAAFIVERLQKFERRSEN